VPRRDFTPGEGGLCELAAHLQEGADAKGEDLRGSCAVSLDQGGGRAEFGEGRRRLNVIDDLGSKSQGPHDMTLAKAVDDMSSRGGGSVEGKWQAITQVVVEHMYEAQGVQRDAQAEDQDVLFEHAREWGAGRERVHVQVVVGHDPPSQGTSGGN